MNNINIKTGLYAICDKEKEIDILKCCLNQCDEPINFCYNNCNDEYNKENNDYLLFRCNETCVDQRNYCHNVCLLGNKNIWNEYNNYFNCVKKECENINNVECIKNNNLNIKKCFLNNCKLSNCNIFYDIINNLKTDEENLITYKQKTKYAPIKQKKEDHMWEYIIITTIIAFIIIFFIYNFIY